MLNSVRVERETAAVGGAILLAALVTGALLPLGSTRAAVAAAIGPSAVAIVTIATARIGVVVFGGLLVLQASQGLSAPKLIYFLAVGAAVAAAVVSNRDLGTRGSLLQLRLIVRSLTVVVAGGLLSAVAAGTPLTAAGRDAAPYVLLAIAPLIAIDAARHVAPHVVTRLFVLAGVAAALSFALTWTGRRGLASLPLTRLLFPSLGLAVAFFCYAFARAQYGRCVRRRWWIFAAGAVLGLLLVTATRSSLAVLVAPLAMGVASRRGLGAICRALWSLTIVVFLSVAAAAVVAYLARVDLSAATARLKSLADVPSGGIAGQSLQERLVQTRLAWHTFVAEPLLGHGLGHAFVWRDQFGATHAEYNVDTSLGFAAKCGLLGCGALAISAVALRRLVVRAASTAPLADRMAIVGFTCATLVVMPFASPLEDKGFAFAVIFLLVPLVRAALAHENGGEISYA